MADAQRAPFQMLTVAVNRRNIAFSSENADEKVYLQPSDTLVVVTAGASSGTSTEIHLPPLGEAAGNIYSIHGVSISTTTTTVTIKGTGSPEVDEALANDKRACYYCDGHGYIPVSLDV